MEKIKIGKIVGALGLKGEVKVYNYSDSLEIYELSEQIFAEEEPVRIESVRQQKNTVVLKLSGMNDRNAAEAARGRELFITEKDLPPLPEGQFYVRDIIGMEVREQNGAVLGRITDVLQNSAQDLLEVERRDGGKKLLIPKVNQFVVKIDGKKREVTVRLLEGMLEL